MPTLHRGEHFLVQHHLASAYLRVARTEAPFESVGDAIYALNACRAALSSVEPSRHGILFDWRLSPISTDPSLHRVLVDQVDTMAEPFARRAILLATPVGAMQASRVGRTLGNQRMSVFHDDAAAVAFVTRVLSGDSA